MKKHGRAIHNGRAIANSDESVGYGYKAVQMQRLWRQKRDIDYFIVNIATETRPRQTKRVRQGLQAVWNG